MYVITGEMYVIYMALSLAVEGKSSLTAAVVPVRFGMWLQHDMKCLLEEIPKLLKIMKPVHRVASLLACQARLESDRRCSVFEQKTAEQESSLT